MDGGPSVFNIAAGEGFSDRLAEGLLQRYGGDPLAMNRVTLLLPTRRGMRAVRDAFLRQAGGRAMLLPRMRAIGDVDEEELLFDPSFDALGGGELLELPPAITTLRRQLLLLHLIARHRDIDPAQAAPLARELADLLDRLQTEDVPLSALEDLVPDDLAAHWQQTLEFLNLLAAPWQALLAAEGCMDQSARRNVLLRAQAERWSLSPPRDPIIVAGSTGSIPATAALITVVAHLPQGAVVLPGLDIFSDEAAWAAIDQGHAQFGLRQLLRRIGMDRSSVRPWQDAADESPRHHLLREALRPAETTDQWRRLPALEAAAAIGLVRIDCADAIEEAGVIALSLRRALETPGRSAALITPDRGLARRVAVEMKRWGVAVDDSAGLPLASTPAGSFLRLTAEMLGAALNPIDLLATLKHPLALAGREAATLKGAARDIDRHALRGPRPGPGFTGLAAAMAAARHMTDRAKALLDDLVLYGTEALSLSGQRTVHLADLLSAHVHFAEWLATDQGGQCHLWAGDGGEAAMRFIADLLTAAAGLPVMAGSGYADLLNNLMAGQVMRPAFGLHPRLHIWGPLEARLQQADLVILGGLNEGTWPAGAEANAWLSRPMAAKLGLAAPERRIGLAAHDFAQAACGAEVILTRAKKMDGTPSVPSRWLLRLEQVLTAAGLTLEQDPAEELRTWQEQMDAVPGPPRPVQAPECRPPLAARPRQMSVTQVETWIRDPYGVYAGRILGLRALDPIAADPSAADYGNAVHQALEMFARRYPYEIPAAADAALLDIGRQAFGEMLDRPGIRAFWWPRFQRITNWFLAQEVERRPEILPLVTEAEGSLILPGPAGDFKLTAIADRIDRLADGSLGIIDYKTGVAPRESELLRGEAPQLPLEAAIAQAGGFAEVPRQSVSTVSYWRVTGGRQAGEIRDIKANGGDLAEQARQGLVELIAKFDDPETPYRSRPRPAIAPRFSDYDHLARIKEWSAGGPGDF
ncbi:MAG: double-strand break repair protein AddB [Alphaproteobacteria bacterium]|jgi:ATP-dependent helicase/nuclease subunit B|nr:double-strand break repair protein AddB [Alphaproteobacteria bacterium]MDP6255144.1 double-strand break repair protein AddB [Alphaproteobacteria bacterium]MDP7053557.1 double-strand break repair protein AddB [Alphaproteobacteria bacterium]MDP7230149.1 double-strand break repair protein AddB [Alphaproteobacteria bacterium]MDP7459502.1 double-strand break repair protein AddB [Alphaproteobacteria bacterium]|tara:strand:- start:2754 stop:5696 length:2943 start_codon:yes stop_codon:yes gene_type:complete